MAGLTLTVGGPSVVLLYRRTTDVTDELRALARALAAHSIKLREAAEMARKRSIVLREVSRLLRESSQAKREHAETAQKRHSAD
jgi:hypothetical protein